MRIRGIAVVITLGLITTSVLPAFSASLAGAKCTKVGAVKTQSGKAYTCIKSGKKLIWNKGVTISVPIATPTPTPKPTPKELTLEEKWDATGSLALTTFRKNAYVSEGKKPSSIPIYDFSPNFWPQAIPEVKRRFENATSFWDRFHSPTFNVYLTMGTYSDLEWGCQILNRHDPNRTLQGCRDDQASNLLDNYHVSRGYDIKNGSNHWYLIQSAEVMNTRDFWPRIEHEYVHTIQEDILREDFRYVLPCWILETSAEYIGILSASQGNAALFLDQRHAAILDSPDKWHYQASAEDLAKWLKDAAVPWVSRNPTANWDQCAPYRMNGMYHQGIIAIEWMVDRVGVEGIYNIYKDLKTMSWEATVQKHFKMAPDEMYAQMGQYMQKEIKIALDNRWIRMPKCPGSKPDDPRALTVPGCRFGPGPGS